MNEEKLFQQADNDPASKDAKDALRLIEYLEEQNKRLNELEKEKECPTFGERVSDTIADFGGSWGFIISFLVVLLTWVAVNITGIVQRWDPYPFILLNLCLSTIAALQAPIILMSQNRQAQRDRLRANIDMARDRLDLEVDTFAAKVTRDALLELRVMKQDITEIKKKLKKR